MYSLYYLQIKSRRGKSNPYSTHLYYSLSIIQGHPFNVKHGNDDHFNISFTYNLKVVIEQ